MKTLYAFYDLAVGPVSFDVVPFLVQAKVAQAARHCKRLHCVVVPAPLGVDGMFRDKRNMYDADEMHWRLWNIVVPACRMVGASVTVAADWTEAKRLPGARDRCWPEDWDRQSLRRKPYLLRQVVEAARAGAEIPRLQPLAHARRAVREQARRAGKPLVTLTMRRTYEPERNADPALWQAAAAALRINYHVVPLFDTADELNRGAGYGALNLELRAALYCEAVQNFHCHGGPMMLSWFQDAPFVVFGAARPHEFWAANWVKNVGLAIGEQLPWARPGQRLRYDEVTAAAMNEEIALLNAERAAA